MKLTGGIPSSSRRRRKTEKEEDEEILKDEDDEGDELPTVFTESPACMYLNDDNDAQ
jgi:hypothetical protein